MTQHADPAAQEGEPSLTYTVHELKTWPEYFSKVLDGSKRFELRRNDRGFKVGDVLRLREWRPTDEEYTGRSIDVRVGYVTDNTSWLNCGVVAMSIEPRGGWRPVADVEGLRRELEELEIKYDRRTQEREDRLLQCAKEIIAAEAANARLTDEVSEAHAKLDSFGVPKETTPREREEPQDMSLARRIGAMKHAAQEVVRIEKNITSNATHKMIEMQQELAALKSQQGEVMSLQQRVYAWLGRYRDGIDAAAVESLQDILGPLWSEPFPDRLPSPADVEGLRRELEEAWRRD